MIFPKIFCNILITISVIGMKIMIPSNIAINKLLEYLYANSPN